MKDIIDRTSLARRLGWFVALWAAGFLTVTLVGLIIRFWL
jgi:hypothetical protein